MSAEDVEASRIVADAMKEAWDGQPAHVVMSALTLATAEALSSCEMMPGADINSAMATFDRQVREIYAVLTEDMRS